MAAQQLRVLLVEDNPLDVRLVEEYLADCACATALEHVSTMAAALQALQRTSFDAVLLDLMLPDCTGLDTVFAVRSAAGPIPIVVLSGTDNESDAIEAVRLGAQDYLVKRKTDSEALVRSLRFAIERAARAQTSQPDPEASRQLRAALASLTTREREVLNQILVGKTLKQIALQFGTSYNTVKNQRASIIEKLGADSDADLVRMMMAAGLGAAVDVDP